MKIYVASAWRCNAYPSVVRRLRECGYEVYDFRNPQPDVKGFSWSDVHPEWSPEDPNVTPDLFRSMLKHPEAVKGFNRDMQALLDCDVCVLVNPWGRSAHLELGWAVGAGKRTVVCLEYGFEPDLMYKMCDFLVSDYDELYTALSNIQEIL